MGKKRREIYWPELITFQRKEKKEKQEDTPHTMEELELSPMLRFAQQMQNETVSNIWMKLQQGFVMIEQRTLSPGGWMELYKFVLPVLYSPFPSHACAVRHSIVHFFYSCDKNESTGERQVAPRQSRSINRLTRNTGVVPAHHRFH